MSKSAFTIKAFAIYLFVVGVPLLLVPNLLLPLFLLPETTEIWIRVVGLIACMLGIYGLVAAKHEITAFFEASVLTRSIVFVAFTSFALLGLAKPTIALFGVMDLLGALWTYVALKADARSGLVAA